MTLLSICIPCQTGDHKHHVEVIQAVPEGMIGGSKCKCKGECPDLRYMPKPPPWLDRMIKIIRESS